MSVARLNLYRRDLQQLWSLASRDLSTVVATIRTLDVVSAREMLKQVMPEIMDPFLGATTDLSIELLEELYSVAGDFDLTDVFPASWEIDRTARWAVNPMTRDNLTSTVTSRVNTAAESMIYDTARLVTERGVITNFFARKNRKYGTITRHSVTGNRVAFQRIPKAGACAFCQMLASRGAVYFSAASAGRVVGAGSERTGFDKSGKRLSGGIGGGIKARGKRALGSDYHDCCRCVVQPVLPGSFMEDYGPRIQRQYEDKYELARTDKDGNPITSTKGVLARWRELEKQSHGHVLVA